MYDVCRPLKSVFIYDSWSVSYHTIRYVKVTMRLETCIGISRENGVTLSILKIPALSNLIITYFGRNNILVMTVLDPAVIRNHGQLCPKFEFYKS